MMMSVVVGSGMVGENEQTGRDCVWGFLTSLHLVWFLSSHKKKRVSRPSTLLDALPSLKSAHVVNII